MTIFEFRTPTWNRRQRQHFWVTLATCLLCSCALANESGPPDELLLQLVETKGPQAIRVAHIDVQRSPKGQSKTRFRVSMQGRGVLLEDFIAPLNPGEWQPLCPGYNDATEYRSGDTTIYHTTAKAKQTVIFKGRNSASLKNGEWRFSGRHMSYFDEGDVRIRGNRLSLFDAPLLVGTDAFNSYCQQRENQ